MLKIISILTFFAISAATSNDSENSCDYLNGQGNLGHFDTEKYAGRWILSEYVINSWRTSAIIHENYECLSHMYELNSNKTGYYLQTEHSLIPTRPLALDNFDLENFGNATTVFSTENTPRMTVSGPYRPGTWQELLILDTDYDSYAIEYICMSYTYKMIRLMTRTPAPPTKSVHDLFYALLESSELKQRSIVTAPQINCKT